MNCGPLSLMIFQWWPERDWRYPAVSEAMSTMSTAILLAMAVLSSLVLAFLRGRALANRSPALLWFGLGISLLVAMSYLVVLKARLVPITPVNFAVIVVGIIYFGILESMRIHRSIAGMHR